MQRLLFGVIHVPAPAQEFSSAAGVTTGAGLIVKGHVFGIGTQWPFLINSFRWYYEFPMRSSLYSSVSLLFMSSFLHCETKFR